MDKKLEIKLGTFKSVNSINVENYDKIELLNNRNNITEFDIRNVLNVTDVYEQERQNTQIYRIYGSIEWLSILNGMPKDYEVLKDIFTHGHCSPTNENCNYKNIYDDFDFYLVKPATNFDKITSDGITYVRNFEVIATPYNFELMNAGYSKNIYNDQKYSFIFDKEFDITSMTDAFGFPITELYLHPRYNKAVGENTYRYRWSNSTGNRSNIGYGLNDLNIGDVIYGDKIEYSKRTFKQYISENQKYIIQTPYKNNYGTTKYLRWKYNPFIPIKLRYFANELKRANTGTTSYDLANEIPYYATELGDGNMVWRNFLPQGYVDPLTGEGVDHPFVNKKRYSFNNIILDVIPDLDHSHTATIFTDINFDNPTLLNTKPQDISNLDNIGKPCQ